MKRTDFSRSLFIIPTHANIVLPFTLTRHAETRMAQRNLTDEELSYVLEFGYSILKQGFQFYYITQKCHPKGTSFRIKERLDNLIVVTHNGSVITAYRAKNASKHLRRKSSELFHLIVAA